MVIWYKTLRPRHDNTTDAEGYYLFDKLTPGEYSIKIPMENFAAGKVLAEMISSQTTEIDPMPTRI